jgi:glycosyltransferase involved in cell wall biosynthesis
MDAGVAPFAAPRRFGSAPLKVLEMMAAGLPVVATRMDGVEPLIEHRRSGYLVPAGDSSRVAEGLIELALRPLWRQKVGAAARRAVLEGHTSDAALDRILEAVRHSDVRPPHMSGFSSIPN